MSQVFQPHPYQAFCIQRIIDSPYVALWLDMGLGKTVSTLTAITELKYNRFAVRKVLVIAPKKVAEATWSDEVQKWEHLKLLRVSVVLGSAAKRIRALCTPADVYVINRDNVAWLVDYYKNDWPFDMVVLDEASSFKNHQSQRWRRLRSIRPHIKRIVELTGTPSPQSLCDLWPQIYLLDQGQRLGKTIGQFRERYMLPDKRDAQRIFTYKPKVGAEQTVKALLSDICISMSAKDYLTLPDIIYDDVPVLIDPAAEKQYRQLEREALLEVPDGEITACNAAVLTGKLLQLACGAVYNDDGGSTVINEPVELINLSQAQRTLGWSASGWDDGFSIDEAISAHFDNAKGNIGSIYAVNVLDPDTHRSVSQTTQILSFVSNAASIISSDIILDTFVLTETYTRTLSVTSRTATLYASGLSTDSVVVKNHGSSSAATLTTDYTLSYTNNTLTVTLTSGGALKDAVKIDVTVTQTKTEGTDYTLGYNFGTGTAIIKLLTTNKGEYTGKYYNIDISSITPQTVIGSAADYTGLYAVRKLFLNDNKVPALLCAPYWSQYPEVYEKLVAVSQKINSHWFAYSVADIPLQYTVTLEKTLTVTSHAATLEEPDLDLSSLVVYGSDGSAAASTAYSAAYVSGTLTVTLTSGGALYSSASIDISIKQTKYNNTKEKAADWALDNGYTSEFSKVCWGRPQKGSGTLFHLSSLVVPEYLRHDAQNNDMPFESVDNTSIPAVKMVYDMSSDYIIDNESADYLSSRGITTAISWGGALVIWCPHTAAYKYGAPNIDARGIFDSTIRTLFYMLNGFQLRNFADIGRPMTLRHAQAIVNRENDIYRRMVGIGALLGKTELQFIPENNPTSELVNGRFVFNVDPTVVPPLVAIMIGIACSDAGFETYFNVFSKEVA